MRKETELMKCAIRRYLNISNSRTSIPLCAKYSRTSISYMCKVVVLFPNFSKSNYF